MSPQLVRLLTILLLVLIHLFLYRVIRAVWAGIKPTRNVKLRPNSFIRKHRPASLLIIRTPETLHGQRHELGEEVTIGRAATCEITVDDNYASQIHARISSRDGSHVLEDLGSTNGTYLNRQKVSSASSLRSGDHIQIGSTVCEVAS